MPSGAVRIFVVTLLAALAVGSSPAQAQTGAEETVDQAVCRFIEAAAKDNAIPRGFLTRLIWRESSFRSHAVSPVGAQGIAQFMPGTASRARARRSIRSGAGDPEGRRIPRRSEGAVRQSRPCRGGL
jgi:soluble lytic murein transglycosylase-like protein